MNKQKTNRINKIFIIGLTYTIIKPNTMMIKLLYTSVTLVTVFTIFITITVT